MITQIKRKIVFSERQCKVMDLGLIDYPQAFSFQKKVLGDVIEGKTPQTLLTCEHPHVITLSRRWKKESLLVSRDELQKRGVGLFYADRGGDVTYHGPGQIVLYPIFDLRQGEKDLHLYLRKLEQVIINALRDNFGLNAYRKSALTGVWVGPYKVASIGIGVRQWVTYHGLSLNVGADKSFFSLIKPCGLDVQMASINDFFNDDVSVETVRDMLVENFCEVFDISKTPNYKIQIPNKFQ